MIVRDLVRFALNIVVGPIFGYIGFVLVCWVLLVLPLEGGGTLESRIEGANLMLVFAAPFILAAHFFGGLPALINALFGSVLDRLLGTRALRLVASVAAGTLATWLGDWWLIEGDYEIDVGSRLTFNLSLMAGGAIAALLIALILEFSGPRHTPKTAGA